MTPLAWASHGVVRVLTPFCTTVTVYTPGTHCESTLWKRFLSEVGLSLLLLEEGNLKDMLTVPQSSCQCHSGRGSLRPRLGKAGRGR